MILSVLICTIPERSHHLNSIMTQLSAQNQDGVEIIVDNRDKGVPTGTKRNELIRKATGEYVCFVDDDDDITHDYISSILEAAKQNPDCITFEGWMTTNGLHRVHWIIKLGEKYEARTDPDGVTRYYRFPNHLVPIRRSIASQVQFPGIWQGEDYQWAVKLQPLLKTSVHIPKLMYHYKFITNK